MADIVDAANDISDMLVKSAIFHRATDLKLKPRNACYNCDEHVDGLKLFCDSDCREDYEKRQSAKKGH